MKTPRLLARFKLKPIGLLDRLFSTLLIALLLLGQPTGVVRMLAQESPPADSPPPLAPEQTPRPFVGTDQADYPPGATAYIVGRDFQAGETVALQVLHADGTPDSGADHEPWTVLAGTDGAFQSTWHVCEDDCLGATLLLTAAGQSSGLVARMQFTDGTPSGTSPIPGSLYAMGWNGYGQLGTGDNLNRATPTPVVSLPGGRKVIAVTGGELHSLAQANDGSLWAWGYGGYGSIGNGNFSTTYVPVPVNALPGGRTAVSIAAGAVHNLVLANDGSMWAWGQGGNGQLGNGGSGSYPYPVPVNALPGGRTAVQIAAGGYHNLALANDGSLWAWGYGGYGQIGYGESGNAYFPVPIVPLPGGQIVAAIAAGYFHSLALATDGTIWAWGYGGNGQLGNGGSGNAYTRVAVNPLPGGRVPVAIAAGILHSLALASDGTAWAWGHGGNGRLGNGYWGNAYSPVAVNTLPGGRIVQTIAAAGYHNYALATDDSMWAWGYGYDGELGNGSFITSPPYGIASPVPVNPLPLGKSILRIAGSSYAHGFILASDGNQAPVAANDTFTVNEDTTLSVAAPGVLGNDTDANSQPLTASLSIAPANAAAFALNADGAFTYTPNASFHGTDSFTYRAFDGTDYSLPATVTITVTPVNDAPLVNAQSVTTSEDTAANVTLTGSDVDGDALTFSVVSGPTHGTLSGTAPTLAYTPAANYNGPDSFTYKVNDGTADSGVASVTISVIPVNDAPEANAQSVTTPEDTAASITLTGSDVDGDTLSFSVVTPPAHGALSGAGLNLVYTPAANYNGPDSFTFKANDGALDSAVVTVSITVTAVNDGPQLANPGNKLVNELEPLAFTLSATDVDLPTDTLTYSIAAGVQDGMILDASSGAFAWMPTEAQGPGVYTVTFRVTDSAGSFSEQTITITVSEVNIVPMITDVPTEAIIPELASFTFDASGSDADAPVQTLTFSLIGAPTGATIDATTGVFNWTPAEDQGAGDYTFAVRISDGVTTADSPIVLHVTEMNVTPVADAQSATTPEDTALLITLTGSDVDLPANTLTYSVSTGPLHGSLSGTAPYLTYTPAENYNGPDSFTFKANDGTVDSGVATVTINVTPVNDAPLAKCTNVTVSAGAGCTAAASINNGSFDPDAGDTVTVTQTPAGPYSMGQTTVTLTVTDNHGASSTCTATVTVQDTTAPVAPVLADVTGQCSATVTAPTTPDNCAGAVTGTTSDPLVYNTQGTFTVHWTFNDGNGNSSTANQTVIVQDTIAPVAPLLANVTGQCSAFVTAPTTTDNCAGTVTGTTGDPLVYNSQGTFTVHWTFNDGNGNSSTANQTVIVQDTIAPVIVCPSNKSVNANQLVCTAVVSGIGPTSAGDNCSGYTIAYTLAGATTGSGDNNASGSVFNIGVTTVTYTITDAAGLTASCSFTVTVLNSNPVVTLTEPASGSLYAINTPVNFTATFTDAGGGTHTGTWLFDAIPQAATIVEPSGATPGSANATYTFTEAGVYTVKLTVNDSCGGSGTADQIGGMDLLVVVYDPSDGFVTGGGWINSPVGAYVADPSLTGKANFGFVSKYQKGANVPTGNTEFQFKAGNLNFSSTAYQWLVVAGTKAQYKGDGTINGAGNFGFLLTATDGQITGGGGVDKFRIKIWDKATSMIVYDNAMGASDDIDSANPQVISGGSIVIHKVK